MTRVLLLGFVLLTTACGGKSFESLCANQVPPPAECNTACDPAPGATTACPSGFHCSADGKCDTVCTVAGGQCGSDYSCTSDGYCKPNDGSGSNPQPDADCPAVHFTATKTTPSVQLLIDRSGSMLNNFLDKAPATTDPVKYDTVETALVGPQGVVTQLQGQVYFGATLFSADSGVACPTLKVAGRALNNLAAVQPLIHNNRPQTNARTPTPPSIDAVVADFMANPPPAGSPPVIVLATDGIPNECGSDTDTRALSVDAAKKAYAKGIRLFILGVGTIAGAQTHLQDMASAGQGGDPNAKAYTATDPASLAAAFQDIIRGVLSCDLKLSGQVDAAQAQSGTVSLNGAPLTFGTDWTVDKDGVTLHLIGNACTTLKNTQNPTVDATFSCGAVIF